MSSKRSLVVAFVVIFMTLVGVVLLVASSSPAVEDPPTSTASPTAQPAPVTVVSTSYIRPKRVVYRKLRFSPPSTPSVGYVRNVILPYEAARAGASLGHLINRTNCESGFHWWAANGQYHGIGQFASSTFWRGVTTIGSRRISFTSERTRAFRVIRVRTYSDGNVERVPRWKIHQRIITRHVGRLRVVTFDAWTEARIMAQAMVGRSAVHDSEWECR